MFPRVSRSERIPRIIHRPATQGGRTEIETAGDFWMRQGSFDKAVDMYTTALETDTTNMDLLNKRCAAYAYIGKYKRCLLDAERVAYQAPSAKALRRVHDIKRFMEIRDSGKPGHETAHITLLTSLTPAAFKQW